MQAPPGASGGDEVVSVTSWTTDSIIDYLKTHLKP